MRVRVGPAVSVDSMTEKERHDCLLEISKVDGAHHFDAPHSNKGEIMQKTWRTSIAVALALAFSAISLAPAANAAKRCRWEYECYPYKYACATGIGGDVIYCTDWDCDWEKSCWDDPYILV